MTCSSLGNRLQMLGGGAEAPLLSTPPSWGFPHPVPGGDPRGPYLPCPLCFLSTCLPFEPTGDPPHSLRHRPHHVSPPPQGVLLNPDHRLPIRTWPREYWEARPPALAPPLPHSVTSAYPDGLGLLIHRIKLVLAKLGSRPIREGVLLTTTCPQTAPPPLRGKRPP